MSELPLDMPHSTLTTLFVLSAFSAGLSSQAGDQKPRSLVLIEAMFDEEGRALDTNRVARHNSWLIVESPTIHLVGWMDEGLARE